MLKPYDIFISYVVEDREVVEAIYNGLINRGLKVWYARKELYAGVDIRDLVNNGLSQARYGVAIISGEYNSHWSQGELFFFISTDRLLPVLHGISLEEAATKHPGLIAIYCLDTSLGIEQVIQGLLRVVKPKPALYYQTARLLVFLKKHAGKLFLGLFAFAFVSICYSSYSLQRPARSLVESMIEQRGGVIQDNAVAELQEDIIQEDGRSLEYRQIELLRQKLPLEYGAMKLKNKVCFTDGNASISTDDGLAKAGIPYGALSEPPFRLSDFRSYIFNNSDKSHCGRLKYTLFNNLPLHYEVVHSTAKEGCFEVDIQYSNALRYAEVSIYIDSAHRTIYRQVRFIGVKPREKIIFEKKGNSWNILKIF